MVCSRDFLRLSRCFPVVQYGDKISSSLLIRRTERTCVSVQVASYYHEELQSLLLVESM